MSEHQQTDDLHAPAYSRRLHHAGAVIWSSFLAACIGTMVFFAMFDPTKLVEVTTWRIDLESRWAYTIGFFAFWLLTLCSSVLTLILLLPGNKKSL